MLSDPSTKYQPVADFRLNDRQWPSRSIEKAPVWCSVDLRDGNQALIEPMDTNRKLRMFELLVGRGFKEIEVGFPAASQTDYDFCRELVEGGRIPADVTVQVLVQAREDLMDRTFEAIAGIHRAIVHVYNSTSTLQRQVVFGMSREEIRQLAVSGARLVAETARRYPATDWIFEYSPESFTGTEMDYALEVSESVLDLWRPTPSQKAILNLPATVELSTPNIYADQIEWFDRNLSHRDSVVLSVHPHNDRGTAVAATELALMAGADRVEGTLFGNGERTGNVDIVTLALNLYTQGIEPGLDFSSIDDVIECVEFCNRMPVHERHPYAGQMVFTAFSGSHQDAIKKGFAVQQAGGLWQIPYLPIDPRDLGRTYEAVIRVNSQSGKGGVTFLLERDYGIRLPRRLQIEFSRLVQKISDASGGEVTSEQIWKAFEEEYLARRTPFLLRGHKDDSSQEMVHMSATVSKDGVDHIVEGAGNGPIEAFIDGLQREFGIRVRIADYEEHAIGEGAGATAICFVEAHVSPPGNDGLAKAQSSEPMEVAHRVLGAGMHGNIVRASLNAIISAVNRAFSA